MFPLFRWWLCPWEAPKHYQAVLGNIETRVRKPDPAIPCSCWDGGDPRSTASASSRRPCLSRCGRRRELGVPVAGDVAGSLVGYEYVELDAITSTNKHPSSSRSRRKAFASRALSAIISFLLVKHALPPSCLPSLIRANPADPSGCLCRSRGTPCQN